MIAQVDRVLDVDGDWEANAALIAAAPETRAKLDELIKTVRSVLYHRTGIPDKDSDYVPRAELNELHRVVGAIAKART